MLHIGSAGTAGSRRAGGGGPSKPVKSQKMPADTSDRQELHALVDHVRDSDVASARNSLRTLVSPVELALLNALPDDEPMSPHEREAWEADGRCRQRCEEPILHEEVLGELGITDADLR